jgi:hypothetical protein
MIAVSGTSKYADVILLGVAEGQSWSHADLHGALPVTDNGHGTGSRSSGGQ